MGQICLKPDQLHRLKKLDKLSLNNTFPLHRRKSRQVDIMATALLPQQTTRVEAKDYQWRYYVTRWLHHYW